jgi:hypothetical protein
MLLRIPSSHLYSDDNIIDFLMGFTAVFLFAVTAAVCCYIKPKEMTLLDAVERLIMKIDKLLPPPKPVLPTAHKGQAPATSRLEAITVDAKPHVQTTFVIPALHIGTPPTTPPITPLNISTGLSSPGLKRRFSSSMQLLYPMANSPPKTGSENV